MNAKGARMMTRWASTAVLCLSMAACGGEDDPDEDDAGTERVCSETADFCEGDTICIDGACDAAFGRQYRFSTISVVIPEDNEGEPWDDEAGGPDPFVEVRINAALVVLRTSVTTNRLEASFAESGDATLQEGDGIFVQVYDEDPDGNEEVYYCSTDPIDLDFLRQRGFGCDTGGYRVHTRISPL
jgi:hypothetical protein